MWLHVAWHKVLLFAFSVFMFVLAITLMKVAARGPASLLDNSFVVANAFNRLGGWSNAYHELIVGWSSTTTT